MKSIAILVSLLVATSVSHAAEAKPNIVLILADDLGYADVGVYGCKDVPTPHIDSIAKNGVRFTDGSRRTWSARRRGPG